MIDLVSRTTATADAQLSAAEQSLSQSYEQLWGAERKVKQISIDEIRPYRTPDGADTQPRKIRQWKVDVLVATLEDIGIVEPLVVRELEEDMYGKKYEMLSGHHRLLAAKRLNFATVPCIVKTGLSDEEAYKILAESNPPREKDKALPSEYAKIFSSYMTMRTDSEDKTAKKIAEKFCVSKRQIYRYLKFLELPKLLQDEVDEGFFPFGRVEDALRLFTKEQLEAVAEYILRTEKKIGKVQFELLCEMAEKEIEFTVENIVDYFNRPPADEPEEDEEGTAVTRIYQLLRSNYEDKFSELTDYQIDELIMQLVEANIDEI